MYMTFTVKEVYLYISRISGERFYRTIGPLVLNIILLIALD